MKDKEFDILERMEIGVKRGVALALERHKKLGHPIAVWRNGKVVIVPPEDINVQEYPDIPSETPPK